MNKIAIDAGHGRYHPSKKCLKSIDPKETPEWVLNNRIATKIVNLLNAYKDVETLRLDDVTGETDVPLIDRTNKANKWGADWVFSCHHNAGIHGGKGGGIVVFTYTTTNSTEKAMQKAIYESCMAHGGLAGRANPMNSANFHMVREPKGNAILIEYGFMDSITDTPIILTEDFSDRMANATVKAIAKQLKLVKKEVNPEMTEAEIRAIVADEFAKQNKKSAPKKYHYFSELPNYAQKPIRTMWDNGYLSGRSAGDLDLSEDMMRLNVQIARILKDKGMISY